MSNKDFLYPDVSVQQMRFVEMMRRLHKDHPDYFTDPRCPYPAEVARYFRSWFDTPLSGHKDGAQTAYQSDLLTEDREDALYREVVELYTSLKNAKPSAGDSSESMGYFRTATSLLEKLVGYQERCLGIKQVSDFHAVMIEIMEDVLTEDQRNAVMAKMKDAIKSK